jgi:GNAT superfamily N-acetyltransferase
MAQIRQAQTKDRSQVRELFWKYLQWANAEVNAAFDVNFDIEAMLEEDIAQLHIFFPPDGRLLLATEAPYSAGLACLKKLREDIGEIKRMYVRPEFRGQGIGRALLEGLLVEAAEIGYVTVRLDSARFMRAAHALYRSAGFTEIEPYPESEIPPEFQAHWIFLSPSSALTLATPACKIGRPKRIFMVE